MPKAKSNVEIKNRRASFDYEFLETYCGNSAYRNGNQIHTCRQSVLSGQFLLFQQRGAVCEKYACG